MHAQSCPTLCNTWTVACQVPLSVGFPRQDYWSGVPFPTPEHLPDPEIEPMFPALAGRFFTNGTPGKYSWETPKFKSVYPTFIKIILFRLFLSLNST